MSFATPICNLLCGCCVNVVPFLPVRRLLLQVATLKAPLLYKTSRVNIFLTGLLKVCKIQHTGAISIYNAQALFSLHQQVFTHILQYRFDLACSHVRSEVELMVDIPVPEIIEEVGAGFGGDRWDLGGEN